MEWIVGAALLAVIFGPGLVAFVHDLRPDARRARAADAERYSRRGYEALGPIPERSPIVHREEPVTWPVTRPLVVPPPISRSSLIPPVRPAPPPRRPE